MKYAKGIKYRSLVTILRILDNPVLYLASLLLLLIILQSATYLITLQFLDYDPFSKTLYSLREMSIAEAIVGAVIFAPILETFIVQFIPISVIADFRNKSRTIAAILVSAVLFCFMHFSNDALYPILVLPGGLGLAFTFYYFEKKNKTGFLMTALLHAIYNGVGLIFYL